VNGEIRVDPRALARQAEETLSAAAGFGAAMAAIAVAGTPPSHAFGDPPAAAALHAAIESATSDAESAVGRLGGVCEVAADRLYRAAFAYRQADVEAATRQADGWPGRRAPRATGETPGR
jgi:hypothetical protein